MIKIFMVVRSVSCSTGRIYMFAYFVNYEVVSLMFLFIYLFIQFFYISRYEISSCRMYSVPQRSDVQNQCGKDICKFV